MPRNEAQERLEPLPGDPGTGPAANAAIPDLPYVRLTQRGRPPRERRSLWTLLALVLLGHVLLAWLAYLILRPAPYGHAEGGAFVVTLVEPSPELPPPPPLVPPPPLPGQPPPPLVHREAPAPGAITATLEGVKAPRLDLYDSNGQIRLSSGASKQSIPAPAYSAPALQGSQIYSGKSPVPYKPTEFNKDWAPDHESLGAKTIGRAYNKAVEKTTAVKTVHLPGGLKVKCGISPLLLMAGCQSSPPPSAPPDELENDVRLSMPPPTTLTGKKVPLPSSASSVPPPASGVP
ncbi:MAG: hypothetical protein JSR56_00415 [Proteobacteria bacterium]|nr:hypothetical protein [Pseudomonadota bacterium]